MLAFGAFGAIAKGDGKKGKGDGKKIASSNAASGQQSGGVLPDSDVLTWRVTRRPPLGPTSSAGWAAARPTSARARVVRIISAAVQKGVFDGDR